MEKIIALIYLTVVFILVVVHITFYIWREMERYRAGKIKEPERGSVPPIIEEEIMGKTFSGFLEPPADEDNPETGETMEAAAFSEPVPDAETEPDVSPDQVEIQLNQPVDIGEDMVVYLEDESDSADDLSRGLTFEEIGNAVDVIFGNKSCEDDKLKAGETFSFMPSDLVKMICMNENNVQIVESLIASFLDHPKKKKPKPVSEFDLNMYV